MDIVTSPSPSDVRGRFGSFKPSRVQPILGPNPEGQNQGGSVPLGVSRFLHQVSRQRELPVFDFSSQLLGLWGAPSPSGGIKDFCGVSLLRLFFTALFHLHPSEGFCPYTGLCVSTSARVSPQLSPTRNESTALFLPMAKERETKFMKELQMDGFEPTTDFVPFQCTNLGVHRSTD